jgi:N-acetylglutamate synthase-like GNAT family acetyltransferase
MSDASDTRSIVQTDLAISVRSATASDAPALAELVNQAYSIESFFVDGDRTNAAEIERLLDRGTFVVLEHAGGLAAAVYVERGLLGHRDPHGSPSPSAPPPLRGGVPSDPLPEMRQGFFGMLSVLPDLQGHGLGTRLVRIAEAMCESAGCHEVNLRIINLREELARWYRSLGYQEVGTTPYEHRTVKQPCHFVEMRKSLRPVTALGAVAA